MKKPPPPFEGLDTPAITDPAERARSLGRTLDAIPGLQKWLRQSRQEAVNEMRAAGMSYAAVARELGVSRARAQQIAEGRTSGKRGEPAASQGAVDGDATDKS